jgi:uncharacterized protein YfbU (UPF0304 family)
MEFTNEQKLIVALLTDIHAALNIEDSLDPVFVQDKVNSGRTWALHWKYPGLFQDRFETPANVKFVADVLDLWERLEQSYASINQEGVAALVALSPTYGDNVSFPGFDGNGGDYDGYSTARILIEELGRWSSFKGRDLNAHMPMADVYERMLDASRALGKGDYEYEYSVEEMAEILNARIHPDNR